MPGWTNRFKYRSIGHLARAESLFQASGGTQFRLVLTKTTAPTADTNTFSELTEIATGQGYTAGGVLISRNSTDFPTWEEDDTNDQARVIMRDVTWTNTGGGGTIPSDGNGAEHAVLIDNHATPGSREVGSFGAFGSAQVTGTDQDFVVQNYTLQLDDS